MASQQQLNTGLSRVFFADIVGLHPRSERQYDCAGISDIHYCQLGVLRCLSSSETGQEFLQYHADQNVADIEAGHFFKALKDGKKKEHDMAAIKRSTAEALRYGAAVGRKVMLIPDQRLYVAGLSDRAALQTRLGHRENLPPTQEQDEGAQIMGQFAGGQEKPRALRMPGSQPAAVVRKAHRTNRGAP